MGKQTLPKISVDKTNMAVCDGNVCSRYTVRKASRLRIPYPRACISVLPRLDARKKEVTYEREKRDRNGGIYRKRLGKHGEFIEAADRSTAFECVSIT